MAKEPLLKACQYQYSYYAITSLKNDALEETVHRHERTRLVTTVAHLSLLLGMWPHNSLKYRTCFALSQNLYEERV
jgi:hypothetical protein